MYVLVFLCQICSVHKQTQTSSINSVCSFSLNSFPCHLYALPYSFNVIFVPIGQIVAVYSLQNITIGLQKFKLLTLLSIDHATSLQVGSIEGRVGVHHLDDAQQNKNFTFKCHRENNEIYSVNSLNFHPVIHHIILKLVKFHFESC